MTIFLHANKEIGRTMPKQLPWRMTQQSNDEQKLSLALKSVLFGY